MSLNIEMHTCAVNSTDKPMHVMRLTTEIALIYTTKPSSGNNVDVIHTNPIKSNVVRSTTPQITRAILIYWMMVTARKTTAIANSIF